jgi:hypothetical protein
VIDLREEPENAPDSMRINSESVSNEIDETAKNQNTMDKESGHVEEL